MKSFIKETRAQGALEYLLIIGGAILLAAIVIAVVINVSKTSKSDVNNKLGQYQQSTDLNATEIEELGKLN